MDTYELCKNIVLSRSYVYDEEKDVGNSAIPKYFLAKNDATFTQHEIEVGCAFLRKYGTPIDVNARWTRQTYRHGRKLDRIKVC